MDEKRRFPRVGLERFASVEAVWPSGVQSHVLDMSYGGAAIARPKGLNLALRQALDLSFQMDGQKSACFPCEVLRLGDHVVGVQFGALSPQARLEFDTFLKDKLLGLSLKLVNPHYYGVNADFTYWFHGPNETNIFLWMKKKALHKAVVELEGSSLTYENEQFSQENSVVAWMRHAALELISQVQESHELLEPLVAILGTATKKP